jgi:hypothetical protein
VQNFELASINTKTFIAKYGFFFPIVFIVLFVTTFFYNTFQDNLSGLVKQVERSVTYHNIRRLPEIYTRLPLTTASTSAQLPAEHSIERYLVEMVSLQ